jgi:hypothetical protein
LGQFGGSKIGLIGLYHAKKMDDWWMLKIQVAMLMAGLQWVWRGCQQ